jgi:hypothetical protein
MVFYRLHGDFVEGSDFHVRPAAGDGERDVALTR